MMENISFFMGVVECANDPEKLGRVKVRVVGDHTQSKALIPSADLPWAMVMMPVTTASMNGIGQAPVGLVNGSWVMGFYRDGADKQQPIIMGSFGGISLEAANGDVGFNDPSECFPDASKLGEPDTNRHARGVNGKHVAEPIPVTIRKESILENIAGAADTWSEPETPYAPQYPYNYVWEGPYNPDCDGCEWGHIEEWDSTPGSERYFRQHKTSQNFLEIHPDGKEVRKIYGDGFEIDLGAKHLYVEGDYRVTVMGNKDEHIKGDLWQHVEGDVIRVVEGDSVDVVQGDKSTTGYKKIIQRSKEGTWDITEDNHIRLANKNIYDNAGETIKSLAVEENTYGTGAYAPLEIEPIVPIDVTGDSYPSVTLSCAAANEAKVSISSLIVPEIIDYDILAKGEADTQIKIIPDVIYNDAVDMHHLGYTYFKDDSHFSASAYVALSVDAGINVIAGAVLSAPTLAVAAPFATETVGTGTFLIPGVAIPPVVPDPVEETDKIIIDEDTVFPEKIYVENTKQSTPVIPGEVYECK
jgi:hypothetical protein